MKRFFKEKLKSVIILFLMLVLLCSGIFMTISKKAKEAAQTVYID